MGDRFRVAFVCTGNQARSPLAEALYRKRGEHEDTDVASFGTLGSGPAPPLPQALAAAASLGLDISGHRSRGLRRGDLLGMDLVLGFEPFHLAIAIADAGADPGSTFLLGELVPLLETGPREPDGVRGARAAVADADSRRARSRPADEAAILDPLGRRDEVMFDIARRIDDLVLRLVHGLFGDAMPAARHLSNAE
jgi:protein-tyrosine phosphatase